MRFIVCFDLTEEVYSFCAKAINLALHFQADYKTPMRNEDFENSPSGYLEPTLYDQLAFVPNPLPPSLDLGKVTLEVALASSKLGELKGACRRLTNPYILIAPLRRLEAQTSSAMEDTHTTAGELVIAEAGIARDSAFEAKEVANYINALSQAISALAHLPISGRLLKEAHRTLLSDVGRARGENKFPGEYARDQNMIGARPLADPKARLASARFIPPPPARKETAMAALETYINREDAAESWFLIDLALIHYQFETIHPFADGNGRIGRMLLSLLPIARGVLDLPVLYMSPELEDRKSDYIDLMYSVSSEGRWEEWISFFAQTLAESCQRTIKTIDRVLELQSEYHNSAHAVSRSNNINRLVDLLFERPAVQVSDVVERIGITDAAARTLLRQLAEVGIIRELPDFYPRTWIAAELIEVSRP